mgnify:CR=1 FL=1
MKEITEFKYIPISSIVLNSRNNDSDLNVDEIIDEIKDKGLIRPLIVSKVDNKFILKLGTRRFLAFKKLNYNNIFCGIINGETDLDEIRAKWSWNCNEISKPIISKHKYCCCS